MVDRSKLSPDAHLAQNTADTARAISELYERWLEYLAPPEFLNKIY